ncbi:tripartite tricarboxylate transporter substrate binding protein [Paenibacillus xerothermodurans]|uniref:Tripartite tricarboxylate transporter substrate binding protein n=1 Tax=Paenibacillus xerothermodurans TaxID=1977292 RepID=A0A2W1NGC1_PAEXE|nr:tripartite tricarboxylate transporter substrate binding protein [Paenibacillus xerothermodurans]PZE22131.1 tripartite tricarboxylate transporter substrate binding protein [Paenibacillus xerothermodurans]
MKKSTSLLMSIGFALALTACAGGTRTTTNEGSSASPAPAAPAASEAKSQEKYPTKPINLIIAYAAGGGTDVGARMLMPYVEKELGVPINIINKPGGGGWVGWTELANAKPDGYTIGYINTPNLMTGYLDPKQKRKESLDSFTTLANHITDPGAIAISKDEKRFTDITSLIEYAKKNALTATSTGVGSDDHFASLKLNKAFGTKFTAVQNGGAAESQAAVLGGHVDVLFANVGELTTLHKNGEIKIVGVMTDQRSPFLPDVPTLDESGFKGITSWSARGLAAPKGLDPEKAKILNAALEKGINNAEQVKKQGESGLQVDYKSGQDYADLLKKDEQGVIDLKDLMGW